MKTLLHYSPLALFALAYWRFDIYVATEVLMASLVVVLGIDYALTRKLNRTLLGYTLVALVMGAATLIFHDPDFIKFKPSLIYGALAVALLGSQWIGKQVLLQRMLGEALTVPDFVWRRMNLAWAGFFALCALLNWYVAQHYSEATWVKFKLIAFTVLPFIFALAQAPFLVRYMSDESETPPPDDSAPDVGPNAEGKKP
jgi:intracellular septation protein